MTGIFVNYRREDSSAYAGRLYDVLVAHFGQDRVFIDIEAIGPGEDFREVIQQRWSSCEVLVAVIGKQWSTVRDKAGKLRLENETDLVRLEIASALQKHLRVIPVLVGGAEMPEASALPADLQALVFRNAWEISDKRFHQDAQGLVDALTKMLSTAPPSSKPVLPSRKAPECSVSSLVEPASTLEPALDESADAPMATTHETSSEMAKAPDAPALSPDQESTEPGPDTRPRAVVPVADISRRREALLAEQRAISGAVLQKWLRGPQDQKDAETKALLRRTEEVKKELADLEGLEREAQPRGLKSS